MNLEKIKLSPTKVKIIAGIEVIIAVLIWLDKLGLRWGEMPIFSLIPLLIPSLSLIYYKLYKLFVGILLIIFAYNLLQLKKWAWFASIIIFPLSISFENFIELSQYLSEKTLPIIIQAFCLFCIILLFLEEKKFRQPSSKKARTIGVIDLIIGGQSLQVATWSFHIVTNWLYILITISLIIFGICTLIKYRKSFLIISTILWVLCLFAIFLEILVSLAM